MINIVKTVTPLDAQATEVGGTVTALDPQNPVIFDMISEQATDTAIRTNRIDFTIGFQQVGTVCISERPGRTGGDTFATGHTGGFAHRITDIKHDFGIMPAFCKADNIVDLGLAAGTQATRTLNAGIHVDGNRRMGQICRRLVTGFETRPPSSASVSRLSTSRRRSAIA